MAGITTFGGRPLQIKDGANASRNFLIQQDDWLGSNVPKPKFLFAVKFFKTADLSISSLDSATLQRAREGVVFQVKTIDRPKFQIQTDTLNQYNKKRVVQTQIQYQPVTITFHDDISEKVLTLWKDYYRFYYHDGNKFSPTQWTYDQTAPEFQQGTGWGFRGYNLSGQPNNMHYFDRIELYQFFGRRYSKFTYVHPVITMFDHDANDYADGTTGSGIVMQFDYEGIIYDLNDETFGPNFVTENMAEEFGFSTTFFDVNAVTNLPSSPRRRGFIGKRRITIGDLFRTEGNNVRRRQPQPTGKALLALSIFSQIRRGRNAGQSVIGNQNFEFGSNSFSNDGLGGDVSLENLAAVTGSSPSADVGEKARNVRTTMNNFGEFSSDDNAFLEQRQATVNTGLDSSRIREASGQLGTVINSISQDIGDNQTAILSGQDNNFSRTFGTAAALAQNQGVISSISTPSAEITNVALDNSNAAIVRLPDGSYAATERGSAVFNSLRKPTTSIGTRRPTQLALNDPDSVTQQLTFEQNKPYTRV